MSSLKNLRKRIKNSQLANDSFWAIFGNVLGKGLSLIATIWIARILGKELYGEYGFIYNTMLSIAIFSTFGLGYTSTKYIAEYKRTKPEILHNIVKISQNISLVISLITTSIIIIFAEYFAMYVFDEPKFTLPIRLSALYILFNTLARTQIGVLAGFNDFKGIAKVNTIIGVISVVFNVFLAYFYGLYGVLIGLVGLQIVNCLLNRQLIKINLNKFPALVVEKKLFLTKEVINYSFPVALQEALYSVLTWGSGLLLVKYSTYGEVGLSTAAAYWSAIILFIPGILRNVILSHLSASLTDKEKHNKILKIVLIFNFTVTFVLACVVYLLSEFIASFYGNTFTGLKEVLNISVFTTIFSSMSNVYAQAYMSESKNWLMLFFRILRDGFGLIIAYYLLTKFNGMNGALLLAKTAFFVSIFFLLLMGVVYEYKLKNKRL